MPIIPISEFAPDLPDSPSIASDVIYNVMPNTADSYSPVPSFSNIATAINARCQGGISSSDSTGSVRVYAGDATKLYRMVAPGTSFSDVSKVGGYTTPSTQGWNFGVFNQTAIATNYVNPIQAYTESVDVVFRDLITTGLTSLKAKYLCTVKNWLFVANTTDAIGGTQTQRVHWSAVNDPSNFPLPGTQAAANNLSDYQDIPGTHGAIQGIVGNLGASDGAVFFERAVWRFSYSGLPNIFEFAAIENARGLLIPGGLNQFGMRVAYPSEDGFYMLANNEIIPIGKGKIDRFFYNDINSTYFDRVSCTVDPTRGLMIWAYPGANASNGNPNRLLFYSIFLNRWTATEANTVQIEYLMKGATFGQTLEQLNSYGSLEAVPFSLDSAVWAGNRQVLAGFDTQHRYGFFNGANYPAKVDSTDFELLPNQQTKISRIRPLIDNTQATIKILARDAISQPLAFGASKIQEQNGSCGVNERGRYYRVRIETPSGAAWTHISGVDIEDFKPSGGVGGR